MPPKRERDASGRFKPKTAPVPATPVATTVGTATKKQGKKDRAKKIRAS
jgi:hypothetical protein